MDYNFDAVILADGDFPTDKTALDILRNARYLCCCDGAGKALVGRGIMPDAIVGDGDSLSSGFKEKYKDIIHIVDEQEYNDLTKCTRFVIEDERRKTEDGNYPLKVAYLGCTGKREDHTIGNISLMAYYMQEYEIEPYMFTDYGVFIPGHGTKTFESRPRLQVSIFNLDCKELESEGLKWNAYPYRQLWQGTLNEAVSDTFTIKADGAYIIYITYLPKV